MGLIGLLYVLARYDSKSLLEDWAIENQALEFSTFTSRIESLGIGKLHKLFDKRRINAFPKVLWPKAFCRDMGEDDLKAAINHIYKELELIFVP